MLSMGKLLVLAAASFGLALLAAAADGAVAQEALPVLARVGPWPVASHPIAFLGRIWFANSVKGRNHNSADIYSYDPATNQVRYERHLFSQDAGAPVVSGGWLYWPFEDSRFSLGWGHFMATDGRTWRMGTIPTGRIYHVHAMAAVGQRLVAATSAWRAGLNVSDDGGSTWRAVYDHPTANGRVSRIVDLAVTGQEVYAHLIDSGRSALLRFDGAAPTAVPGWPADRPIRGLSACRGWVYALVDAGGETEVWRGDGKRGERLGTARTGWRGRAIVAGRDGLLVVGTDRNGAGLWMSPDGVRWRVVARLSGGTPWGLAATSGATYVTGAGADGQGILWGARRAYIAPCVATPARPRAVAAPVERSVGDLGDRLDRALADPGSYEHHAGAIRDLVHAVALVGPSDGFFERRFSFPMPEETLSMIGGKVQVPARDLGRWVLLWGMALAGRGQVPIGLIAAPWTAPVNSSEKYFDPQPAALWAVAAIGQRDRATMDALIARLARADDPPWLRGDVVGALTTLSTRRFGYDVAAWRRWWTEARASWPD